MFKNYFFKKLKKQAYNKKIRIYILVRNDFWLTLYIAWVICVSYILEDGVYRKRLRRGNCYSVEKLALERFMGWSGRRFSEYSINLRHARNV